MQFTEKKNNKIRRKLRNQAFDRSYVACMKTRDPELTYGVNNNM